MNAFGIRRYSHLTAPGIGLKASVGLRSFTTPGNNI